MVKNVLCILMLATALPAVAGFQLVEDQERDVPATSPKKQDAGDLTPVPVKFVGEPEGQIDVIKGFGRDVELRDAIKQITPRGWDVYVMEDIASRRVTWKGGQRWVDVLKNLAQQQNITVDVEWKQKRVRVSDRREGDRREGDRREGTAQKQWAMLVSDRYVRVSISKWAKEAGYQLVWDVPHDIEVAVDSTFTGSFDDVLLTVLKSLGVSDSPVEAVIYANKVIRIVKIARKD